MDERSVRIGPISLFTLIAVLCLATLAVLSIATANASNNMAKLQGTAIDQDYEAETAAQYFLARIDGAAKAAGGDGAARAQAVAGQLTDIVANVQSAVPDVAPTAYAEGRNIHAEFTCENERILDIQVVFGDDGTYTIEKWNMTAKQNEAQSDTLWSGL